MASSVRASSEPYDIYFIYHPDDSAFMRRAAAQLEAGGSVCGFEEADFGRHRADIAQLKSELLRANTVAVLLSPSSAESQLCNELIQHASLQGKRLLSLILDEDITVEVHPAIAENPFLLFRPGDDFAARIEELRARLAVDAQTQLHTELLIAADRWERGSRRANLLLPPERSAEARAWLLEASRGGIKPAPQLLEFIHGSRRVKPTPRRPRGRRALAAAILLVVIPLGAVLLRALLLGEAEARRARDASATTSARLMLTAAAATEASNSALVLIDEIAATAEALRLTALAAASEATAAAKITETAQASAEQEATAARATAQAKLKQQQEGQRLLNLAEARLAGGDAPLALALAWEARDRLETHSRAQRILREALAAGGSHRLDDVVQVQFQPQAQIFAILPRSRDALPLYSNADWSLLQSYHDHEAPISAFAFSGDGRYLASGARDGELVLRSGTGDDSEPLLRLKAHEGAVSALLFAPGADTLISAGSAPRLALWQLETGERLASFEAAEGQTITALEIAADGQLIGRAGAEDESESFAWESDSLQPLPAPDPALLPDTNAAIAIAEDLHIAPAADGSIDLVASSDERLIRRLGFAPAPLSALEVSLPGDTVAALTDDSRLRLWRMHSGTVADPQRLPAVSGAALSAGGQVFLQSAEDELHRWHIEDSEEDSWQVPARLVASAGDFIAAATADAISIYEAATGDQRQSWRGDWAGVTALHLAPAGDMLLAAGAAGATLFVTGQDAPLPLPAASPLSVAFDPTGARLLTVHDERALLWAADGAALAAFPLGDAATALTAAFSADGAALRFFARAEGSLAGLTTITLADTQPRRHTFLDVIHGEFSSAGDFLLLALADGALQVIDSATGAVLHRVTRGNEASAPSKLDYFAEAETLLVLGGQDLEFWQATAGEMQRRLRHLLPVTAFSRSRDGAQILTRDAAGSYRLWQLESAGQLLARIEALGLPRALTCAERARYRILPLCA